MRNKFKVVKIMVSDGSFSLLYSQLSEWAAWEIAERLEWQQMEKGSRSAWYAATDAGDWQSAAAAFYRIRTKGL